MNTTTTATIVAAEAAAEAADQAAAQATGQGAGSETAALADPTAELLRRVIERPDGYHWLAEDGRQEFGPYATVEETLAAMNGAVDESPEPGESLAEAEQELGQADWVDPDTGTLAEDTGTRLEDH